MIALTYVVQTIGILGIILGLALFVATGTRDG